MIFLDCNSTFLDLCTQICTQTPAKEDYKQLIALVPIGHGQRELIIGDRQPGKTTMDIDTILNQMQINAQGT